MRQLGVFSARGNNGYQRGDHVIARTPRGMEIGEVLSEADEDAVERLGGLPQGQILRCMSSDDSNEWDHIRTREKADFEVCRRHVDALGLEMELVDIEHLFGGERVVVYYLAEHRVDFRELVRCLASEFQTRIEMRQIGVRDEAKLLADYVDCGKPVCCNTHLSSMPPVSIRMSKLQKSTLDPSKISGRCGRLKCCLRYEFPVYEEMRKELPPVGADIVTEQGRARVLAQEILTQQILVQTEDNRRMMVDAAEVLSVIRRSSKRPNRSNNRSPEGNEKNEQENREQKRTRPKRGPSKRRRNS